MSALSDKLKTARTVAAVQRGASMAMADRIIALGAEVAKVRDEAEAEHTAVLKADIADLEALRDELRTLGNGAPETSSEEPEKPAGSEPGVLAANAWHPKETPYEGTTEKTK